MSESVAPADYDLPHKEWRSQQYETVQWLLGGGNGKVALLEAPTGSGKTATARAVGSQYSVTALCRTKMLQQENYADGYGFDALFGRGNYPCALEPLLTGAECEYAEVGMHECPDVDNCAYLAQKGVVMASKLRALNYAYWLTARWPRQVPTDYVVCDEAHLLSDTVLDFCGATFTEAQRREWDLPPFPKASSHGGSMLIQASPVTDAIAWLEAARSSLLSSYRSLERKKRGDKAILRKLRQCERLGLKVRSTLDALKDCGNDWFVKSGSGARSVGGQAAPGFVCRPLTARHHAPKYFLDGWRSVMMSATIGDRSTFARELGIEEYRELAVEGTWPPRSRPVLIPRAAPKLGQAAKARGPDAYEEQARLVAELIKSADPNWSGVIHHTSVKEAHALAGRLARRGLGSRLWLPPERVGTEQQMAEWYAYRARVPNALAITWSWHTGVDLLDEKICIVAKVAFPFLGDAYERARLEYDGKFYLQRTAWTVEQACGRTRRGRAQDYDTPTERRGLVAIVDGNWKRVQKYLSKPFVEALVEV